MNLEVTYMSGAGNLFSVIDNRNLNLSIKDGKKLAPILCEINSINKMKTEGLMFLEASTPNSDFVCNFFNPDGSTGMMCGNGGRAITRFAQLNQMIKDTRKINFSMSGDTYRAELSGSNIRLFMPPPKKMPETTNLKVKNYENEILGYYSNTGTHHYCVDLSNNNIKRKDLQINELGSKIRNHKQFQPQGTNVNFYKIKKNLIHLRTYEKGVEAETGACGTGAVATALTAHLSDGMNFPIHILPTSGEELIIDIIRTGDRIENMILEGPAKVIYQTQVSIPDTSFYN